MAEVRSSLASNGKADWDIVVETSKRAMMVAMASTTVMMMSLDGGLAKAAMCPSFSTAPDGMLSEVNQIPLSLKRPLQGFLSLPYRWRTELSLQCLHTNFVFW